MPRPSKKQDIHVRLSKRAYEILQDLEEFSGFSGSRLVEEAILAVDETINHFLSLDLCMADETLSDKDMASILPMFMSGMKTVLVRFGYREIYENAEKEEERERKQRRRTTKKKSVKEK